MAKKNKIIIDEDFRQAFAAMEETNEPIFLTGKAGTGKSTLLSHFRAHTKKKHIVLAPTGVAALNVKGQTIHSFFGFHPKIRKELVRKSKNSELLRSLDTVVIDEISMVRADLLDCVDKALRLNRGKSRLPFGGVQMIFVGDLYQLPPIITNEEMAGYLKDYETPYFFSSAAAQKIDLRKIELTKVYRQKDRDFIYLLDSLREKEISSSVLQELNSRYDPCLDIEDVQSHVHLTATNYSAAQRNNFELSKLPGPAYQLEACVQGKINVRQMPSEEIILVKKGAKVMFTMNDPKKRWVNGTLGLITGVTKEKREMKLLVALEGRETVEVGQHQWEVFEYKKNSAGAPEEEAVGAYKQYPITLAWALTIHKSQGKTFDKVLVDVGRGAFAHGQVYVALSRCTRLSGVALKTPLSSRDIIVDQAVPDFLNGRHLPQKMF